MSTGPTPRVLVFPFPVTGHVSPMLKLAELLALSGDVHVTFLGTDHSAYSGNPAGVELRTIPDGLPENHPRSLLGIRELYRSINATAKPLLRELLVDSGITCIISDGLFGNLTIQIGHELGIPVIIFRTFSAASFLVYFSIPDIIEAGELPIKGEDDMDRLTTTVVGMESFLRCRDLPSFCRVNDKAKIFHFTSQETREITRAQGLILNTIEDLEGPILSPIRARCNPNTYTVGPLNAHLEERLAKKEHSTRSSDRTCIAWLDSQPPSSVIYVSFGSLVIMTRDQLMEFWHGLVNSMKRFLWVIRRDLLAGKEEIVDGLGFPHELSEATRERGFIAEWVPQEEVLSHVAVGGFLTHSGWNSTIESIAAGVPMICWPVFSDQQVNSRFVSEVWKLGIDMKDVCDRKLIEKAVNDLMVERRDEFMRSTAEMARLAKKSVSPGGSSYYDLDKLISDIVRLANNDKP